MTLSNFPFGMSRVNFPPIYMAIPTTGSASK